MSWRFPKGDKAIAAWAG
ncbi:hypothetical protein SOVF_050190, partial [Spinacia oleracea]